MSALEQLLVVQEHDTTLDQLRHRRASLPERSELDSGLTAIRAKQGERAALQSERDRVQSEEKRIDDEARTHAAHATDVNSKLYSGTVTSPRELQAMQADLDMLKRQISELEDAELEVMEQREAFEAQIATLDAEIAVLETDVQRLRDVIASAEAEIDGEIAAEEKARNELALVVGDQLLADYEKRRAQNRGAGAARLVGTTCQACHLTIPSTEAESVRRGAGNVVAYCDNCGAILVP